MDRLAGFTLVDRVYIMAEEDSKEQKTEKSSSNSSNPAPPMMYFYQPFTPTFAPPRGYTPQGYPAFSFPTGYPLHPYPVPYPQMYMSPHPAMNTPVMNNSMANAPVMNNNRVNVPVSVTQPTSIRPNNSRPQAPVRPQATANTVPSSTKNTEPKIAFPVQNYNLDDPEELEKWKAERRKRFPSATKEKSVDETASPDVKDPVCDEEEEEEGALCEEKEVHVINKRKRICKYFSRGKCNKGDSCVFEHSKEQQQPVAKRNKQVEECTKVNSRPTIFENLLKIEEKERMLKFYECIKLILSHHNNKKGNIENKAT